MKLVLFIYFKTPQSLFTGYNVNLEEKKSIIECKIFLIYFTKKTFSKTNIFYIILQYLNEYCVKSIQSCNKSSGS